MNRRSLNSLPLRKAITGFVNYKTAEGLSERSVDSYRRILEHWAEFTGDKNVAQLTDHEINSYLVYMRTEGDCAPAALRVNARTSSAMAPICRHLKTDVRNMIISFLG